MSLLPFSISGPSSPWDLLAWVAVITALVMGVVQLFQEFVADRPAEARGRSRSRTRTRPAGPASPPRSAP